MAAVNALAAAEARARKLRHAYGEVDGVSLLRAMIRDEFAGRIAVASSFGAESVVMLDLVAQVDPGVPVIFLDTEKLFDETLAYRKEVVARLGLKNVRDVRPDTLALRDRDGTLWQRDTDACCHLRRVLPLERALNGFEAWVTGRKGYHGNARANLETIEAVDGKIKINPLAPWSRELIEETIESRALPRHPLISRGYASIGCWPCTRAIAPGEAVRSGRWHGNEKTECGIHRASWARPPDFESSPTDPRVAREA